LVCITSRGTAIEPRRFDRDFKKVLKSAGLPQDYRLHGLRHFGLSLLAALGVHPRVAMEIAGHTDPKITMEIYSHIASAEMKAAMDKVDDYYAAGQ
jgi:integrase